MPLRPDVRHFYGREWRTITRPRILARAQNRCEGCLKPDGETVHTISGRYDTGEAFMLWRLPSRGGRGLPWNTQAGWPARMKDYIEALGAPVMDRRKIRVVLTVAHMDHDAQVGRHDPARLAALCQRCHLTYDAPFHARNAAATRRRKMLTAEMFPNA